jgi:hypothetical protein
MTSLTLPGMTRYMGDAPGGVVNLPYTTMNGSGAAVRDLIQRPIVLLATAVITEDNLFSNGLFQNVYVFYRMFEAMGWLPLMIVNKKPENAEKIPVYMRDLRLVGVEDLAKSPIPIKLYIEIGMSIDSMMRGFMKMCGAKICKLYLGNILNIDVETPIFYPSMHFAHHVIGELDEIWVSPHYSQHAAYARALNHVNIEKKSTPVAPYVWDPQVLTGDGARQLSWKPAARVEDDVFLVLEPNISFQKCALIPLMILESWFRKHRDWKGSVVVVNGERLMMIPFFRETIWNRLEIVKAGRVQMKGRLDILTILRDYPSAIPVCHQLNNEYNYMVLEYFWTGYPVLHNASDWGEFGYAYKGSDIAGAVELIERIRSAHKDNTAMYRSHARSLAWRHSPYNPEVQRAWAKLIEGI